MENTKKKNWIIAIAVAIIYLAVSILFDLWAFSWIIWVAYAIYRFIVRQLTSSLTILYPYIQGSQSQDWGVLL